MHDGITCQARDVTICISQSLWLLGNGGETKFSGVPISKARARFENLHVAFFFFLMMDFLSAECIPQGGSVPPVSLFFFNCHCSPPFKLGLRLKDSFKFDLKSAPLCHP